MRAIILMGCALLVLNGCQAPSLKERRGLVPEEIGRAGLTAPGAPRRVILVTVAGLESGDFLDPWGHAAGPEAPVRMPHLARLAREGVTGLAALPPSPGATRSTHATLATGLSPIRHEIVSDFTHDESGAQTRPFLDSRMIQGVPLWDAAIGRGVLALDWPTTSLARIELVIPEAIGNEETSWLEQIRQQSTPVLVRTLEEHAARDLDSDSSRSPLSWPTAAEKDAALIEVACSVAGSERDPGLWLLRMTESDAEKRASGVGGLAADAALGRIDRGIGRLLECLEAANRIDDTAFFVVGDAAYHSVHTKVSPNVGLVQAGMIGRDPRASTGVRSWLAWVRSQGQSAYLYARDATNALAARDVLEAEAERTGGFRVISAKDLAEAGGDPNAWFGLVAAPGYEIGNELAGPMIRPSLARAVPGNLRVGDDLKSAVGFVAWGRGVRTQVRLPEFELVDVAPTVAALLGLRLGDDVEGREIRGILRAAVAPPPPGPKRLGVEGKGQVSDYLRRGRILGGKGGR